MFYAIKTSDGWVELAPNEPVILGDTASSYETMLLWTPQQRTAQGIKLIEEEEIPDNKIVMGYTLIDRDNKPVRVWELEDAPNQIKFVRAGDLWERVTDEEAEQIEAAIATQSIRIQNIFRTRNEYHQNHELWPLLEATATQLFGEERATEILAPSV